MLILPWLNALRVKIEHVISLAHFGTDDEHITGKDTQVRMKLL